MVEVGNLILYETIEELYARCPDFIDGFVLTRQILRDKTRPNGIEGTRMPEQECQPSLT